MLGNEEVERVRESCVVLLCTLLGSCRRKCSTALTNRVQNTTKWHACSFSCQRNIQMEPATAEEIAIYYQKTRFWFGIPSGALAVATPMSQAFSHLRIRRCMHTEQEEKPGLLFLFFLVFKYLCKQQW